MSITDNATGGVNEPDDTELSESQETSQGDAAQAAAASTGPLTVEDLDAAAEAEQDTRDANNSEAAGSGEETPDNDTDTETESTGFARLGLPGDVLEAVTKVGYETPGAVAKLGQ